MYLKELNSSYQPGNPVTHSLQEVSDLKRACEMIEKRAAEQKVADEKNHGEEINFLKRTNQQLKAQLEGIISQKK